MLLAPYLEPALQMRTLGHSNLAISALDLLLTAADRGAAAGILRAADRHA